MSRVQQNTKKRKREEVEGSIEERRRGGSKRKKQEEQKGPKERPFKPQISEEERRQREEAKAFMADYPTIRDAMVVLSDDIQKQ